MAWKRYNCWGDANWPGAAECREAERQAVKSYWKRTREAQEAFVMAKHEEGLDAAAILALLKEEWPKHPLRHLRSRIRACGLHVQRYAGWPESWDVETSSYVKQWIDANIIKSIYRDDKVTLEECSFACRKWMRAKGVGHINEYINNRGLSAAIKASGWEIRRREVGMVVLKAQLRG